MGPSGSGKSTLLNLIAGLDKPTSGTVTVAGQRVDALTETRLARYRRSQVGMIFQFFNLLDDLTVADNVLLPAQLAGASRRRGPGPVQPSCWPGWASSGTAIPTRGGCQAGNGSGWRSPAPWSTSPAVLLADEPTGAVDTATGEEIGRLLLDLNAGGQTLVLVTHSPELAARYAKRTVGLLDGRSRQRHRRRAAARRGSAPVTGGAVLTAASGGVSPPPGADHGDLPGAGRGRSGGHARPDPGHQRQRAVPRRVRPPARRRPGRDRRRGQGHDRRAGQDRAPARGDPGRRALLEATVTINGGAAGLSRAGKGVSRRLHGHTQIQAPGKSAGGTGPVQYVGQRRAIAARWCAWVVGCRAGTRPPGAVSPFRGRPWWAARPRAARWMTSPYRRAGGPPGPGEIDIDPDGPLRARSGSAARSP